MKTLRPLLVIVALAALTLGSIGCSESIITPDSAPMSVPSPLAFTTLPTGTTVESVTLHLYAHEASSLPVQVHAVNEAWDEMEVTWNSFGGNIDPASTSFTASPEGWVAVDITAMATAWMNGSHVNEGLLLRQDAPGIPRVTFRSREKAGLEPYVELVLSTGTETHLPVADVFIGSDNPDNNWGSIDKLYTGLSGEEQLDKQSLIRFDLPTLPDDPGDPGSDCTRTRRWWGRHTGQHCNRPDMVSELLPIMVGDEEIGDADEARIYLARRANGCQMNGLTRLASQLLAAKLNVAAGTDDTEIAEAILAADAVLSTYDFNDWRHSPRVERREIRELKRTLGEYNRGLTGPGRCGH